MLDKIKSYKLGDKISLIHRRKGLITGKIINIYVPEDKPDDGLFDIELANSVNGIANDWEEGETLRVGWDFITKINEEADNASDTKTIQRIFNPKQAFISNAMNQWLMITTDKILSASVHFDRLIQGKVVAIRLDKQTIIGLMAVLQDALEVENAKDKTGE